MRHQAHVIAGIAAVLTAASVSSVVFALDVWLKVVPDLRVALTLSCTLPAAVVVWIAGMLYGRPVPELVAMLATASSAGAVVAGLFVSAAICSLFELCSERIYLRDTLPVWLMPMTFIYYFIIVRVLRLWDTDK